MPDVQEIKILNRENRCKSIGQKSLKECSVTIGTAMDQKPCGPAGRPISPF